MVAWAGVEWRRGLGISHDASVEVSRLAVACVTKCRVQKKGIEESSRVPLTSFEMVVFELPF